MDQIFLHTVHLYRRANACKVSSGFICILITLILRRDDTDLIICKEIFSSSALLSSSECKNT